MTQTWDWILKANKDVALKNRITDCMEVEKDCELIILDRYRLHFDRTANKVNVSAASESVPFAHKITPANISYDALRRLLEGDWDAFTETEFL